MASDETALHDSTRDGTHVLTQVGLGISIVLTTLTGVICWWGYTQFYFEPGSVSKADYQGALTTELVTAAILLTGLIAVRHFRGQPWLYVLTGFGIALQLALAAGEIDGATAPLDPDEINPDTYSLVLSLQPPFQIPTSWPLLALVLAALIRVLWSRTRRPRPGR
ncbi:hypothetical protein FB382_003091 [Nocardioides ginsengisegetis]|uniref:Uncharacterized protein n=1 Tax=Nocardioides ginsengisegetis TaxID=661491 RepID=A0A7W3J249_9ACTN|nr:hypothetical protein [Nocardioides ginsengisegetis]MBA8804800.1 hypothetical protein [Nocardioides ginsengisegetis]